MSETILRVSGLSRRFAGLMAVKDVNFTLERGQVLGLIGPNGAGKTTVLSMISGTLEPTTGTVTFEGRDITKTPAFRRAHLGIGRTFQIMRPFPGLTVLDNVAIGALFGNTNKKALSQAREAAYECLQRVELSSRANHRADELGGPDRKRLELAKALAMSPRMLLLDEVMAGLNLVEIDEVIDVIKSLRDQGLSILVIEHVMKAVRSLSDRVLVLHHGERIAEGTSDEVLNDPAVIEAYLGVRKKK
jgi:branched-chain amino acid transport system ATP-binding protein